MNHSDYLKQYRQITETLLGTLGLMLNHYNDIDKAKTELERGLVELDSLDEKWKKENASAKRKFVLNSGSWKCRNGLYWHFKHGFKNLNEAYELATKETDES